MWAIRRASSQFRYKGLLSRSGQIFCVKTELAKCCSASCDAANIASQETTFDGLLYCTRFSSKPSGFPKEVRTFSSQVGAKSNGVDTLPIFRSGFLARSSKNGVSKTHSAGNQRYKSSLVGTSDTTGATTYPKPFCEWLAGIVDGDGSIQVNKKGSTSLEITMGFEDLRLLRYIQNMLGGGIKMRAGAKSYRYRLHSHPGMVKLMNCLNGHIRHSARLLQLHRVCQVLEIPVIPPLPLDAQSNWFAGFFDADGAITIDMKDGVPQLSIRVTNKLLQDIEPYKVVFGGSVYFDSSHNGYYRWSIESRKDVIMMLDYFKSNTFRSHQSQRFFLIEEYYSLYDRKAFKSDSIHHKAWLAFLDKWNKSTM